MIIDRISVWGAIRFHTAPSRLGWLQKGQTVTGMAFCTLFAAICLFEADRALAQSSVTPDRSPGVLELEQETGFGLMLMDQSEAAQAWQARLLASYAAVEISGAVARARIRQVFVNEAPAEVDARYLFPLPDDAAVDKLNIRFGDKWIEGLLKEKVEARQTFERARVAGKRAGLVESLRPNIFTTDLANIAGGELVSVDLEYQTTVKPKDGVFELRLPQVITPRFMPQQHMVSAAIKDWDTLMAELADNGAVLETNDPKAPFGFPAAFVVRLKAGGDIASIDSPSHDLMVRREDEDIADIALRDRYVPADRDFVLRWRLAETAEPAAMLFHEALNGQHYYMAVLSPLKPAATKVPARDVRFVVDTSGSMHGDALDQAKAALLSALDGLRPQDRFEIIQFNSEMHRLFGESVPVSGNTLRLARGYVAGLVSDGGTNMAPALRAALPGPAAERNGNLRQIVFLTDGAVSNETALFGMTAANIGDARLFTIGLGPAPNSWFMRKAAETGRGVFLNIDRVDEAGGKIDALYRKLQAVQLTDLGVAVRTASLSSGPETEIYPRNLPDLYAGEPLYFVMRTNVEVEELSLGGTLNGEAWATAIDTDIAREAPGLAKLWAREKLENLDDLRRMGADSDRIRTESIEIALAHGIAGKYTSFVAVEREMPRATSDRIGGDGAATEEARRDGSGKSGMHTLASVQVAGPATAVGWLRDLLVALAAGIAAMVCLWAAMRRQVNPV
ncbi:marine proteobacterial sortase target protein [Hwanghaeella sp.]|uniref:marine proteobacterial sortase target protein n=1 Tax=Hwanghaeella sp. TaxID=2605943 RepID=UPI003CCC2501